MLPQEVKGLIASTAIEKSLGYDFLLSQGITSDNPITAAALSPNGKMFVTASEGGMLTFWDAATKTKLQEFKGHDDPIFLLRVPPDGNMVLSSSLNGANEGMFVSEMYYRKKSRRAYRQEQSFQFSSGQP